MAFDPFLASAPEQIRVEIIPRGTGYAATVARISADGRVVGLREISTPLEDCSDLGGALAFAISIAIDPTILFRSKDAGSPPPPVADAGTISVVDPITTEATPAVPQSPSLAFRIGSGIGIDWGLAPGASLGLRVLGQIHGERLSFGLEGRTSLFGAMRALDGTVGATPLGLSLVPCVRAGMAHLCPQVGVAALVSWAKDLPRARQGVTPALSAGARLHLDFPSTVAGLRPFAIAELAVALTRTSLLVGDQSVWTSPPAWGGLSLGLSYGPP